MSKLPGTTEAATQSGLRTAIVTGASRGIGSGPSSILVITLLPTLCILPTQRWRPMETTPSWRGTSTRLQPQ
jgi:hypothetical protein